MSDVNTKMNLIASLATLLLSASMVVVLFGGDEEAGGSDEVAIEAASHFKPGQGKTLTSVCADCGEDEADAEPTREPEGAGADGAEGAGDGNAEQPTQEVPVYGAPRAPEQRLGAPAPDEDDASAPEADGAVESEEEAIASTRDARAQRQPLAPQAPSAAPQQPSAPSTPGGPAAPGAPDASHELEAPAGPDTPDGPDEPSGPDAPGTPSAPEQPDAPEEPETPGIPGAPEAPEAPDAPELPDAANESLWVETQNNASVAVGSVETPGVPSQRYETPAVETPATCAVSLCTEGRTIEEEVQTPEVGGQDVGFGGHHVNETQVGPFATIGAYDVPAMHLLTTPGLPATNATTPRVHVHAICSYGGAVCLGAQTFGPYNVTTPDVPSHRTYGFRAWLAYEAYAGFDENGRPDAGAKLYPGYDTL